MATLLKMLGWLLIVTAVVVICYPVLSDSEKTDPLFNAVPAGILIALGAQLLAQGKIVSEKKEKLSLFYLESSLKAYEEA